MNVNVTKADVGYALAFGLVLAGLWELFSYVSAPIPSWGLIFEAFHVQLVEQELIDAIVQGLKAIFVGYFIAIGVGIPVGLLMGLNEFAEQALDPYLNGLYAVPVAAIVPMLIIWFGTGFTVRVVAIALYSFFPIAISTLEGTNRRPRSLMEVANSFGAGWWFKVKNVVLPHQVPYLMTGLQLGSGRAVKGLVVTELIVAVTGFGLLISRWSSAFRLEGVFSVILVLMIMGVAFVGILRLAHAYVVDWETQ